MTDAEQAERKAMADAALRRAIELHAEAYDLDDDGDLLSTFVVTSHWLRADGRNRYMLQLEGGDGTAHVIRGLLSVGVELAVDHQLEPDD